MAIDPTTKIQWCEALRGGAYTQAQGRLRKSNLNGNYNYCCLGVLCDILGAGEWNNNDEYTIKGYSPDPHCRNTATTGYYTLPDRLAEEIGFQNKEQADLSNLNDNGYDFAVIATYIEENL